MTNYPYIAPCSYFLVRSYEIPGSVDHVGILKVGDTTIKSLKKASELTVNCARKTPALELTFCDDFCTIMVTFW